MFCLFSIATTELLNLWRFNIVDYYWIYTKPKTIIINIFSWIHFGRCKWMVLIHTEVRTFRCRILSTQTKPNQNNNNHNSHILIRTVSATSRQIVWCLREKRHTCVCCVLCAVCCFWSVSMSIWSIILKDFRNFHTTFFTSIQSIVLFYSYAHQNFFLNWLIIVYTIRWWWLIDYICSLLLQLI